MALSHRIKVVGAPTHEIMAQGRWKTARMVEIYTRAEAAKWRA